MNSLQSANTKNPTLLTPVDPEIQKYLLNLKKNQQSSTVRNGSLGTRKGISDSWTTSRRFLSKPSQKLSMLVAYSNLTVDTAIRRIGLGEQ